MEWLKDRPWLLALSELKPGKLYFATTTMSTFTSPSPEVQFVYTDKDFLYEGFNSDFGPLHLGQLYRYYHMMRSYEEQNPRIRLVHCTGSDPKKRANAAFLVGAYAMLSFGMTPEQVVQALTDGPDAIPFKPFRDASFSSGPQTITLENCLSGLEKAKSLKFFDLDDLDVDELEEKRDMAGGDLSWLVPDRFLAFCGPSAEPNSPYPRPEQYFDYFHENGVTSVVRLNRKNYDANKFTDEGIKHFDVFLVDGSTPSKAVLHEFLDIAESESGVIAVHCKAGLGRTGTLVGAYLIKHYCMTALEAIAWLRICRPGSVIGSQQTWLRANEKYLTRQGNLYRKRTFGDANKFHLPKYGVYSKRAKARMTLTPNNNAQQIRNVWQRHHQLSITSFVESSKKVRRTKQLRLATPQDPVKNTNGEIRVRTPLKHRKTKRHTDFVQDELRYKKRPAMGASKRKSDFERRWGYIPSIFGKLTEPNENRREKRHYDSGDVIGGNETQGDQLNAVKLKHQHGPSFDINAHFKKCPFNLHKEPKVRPLGH